MKNMKFVYQLTHKRLLEIDENMEEVCDTKMLGFFSSKDKCNKAINHYIKQPGFSTYPNRFFIEKVTADLNDFNNSPGEFKKSVFYLTHEWYDGKFDYFTELGFYSSKENAIAASKIYSFDVDLIEHPEGFEIDEYIIDEMEWKEGFFTWIQEESSIL